MDQLKKIYMKLLIRFGVNIQSSIIRMILLTVMNLSRTLKILLMVIVIYGIRNNIYHPPKFLVFSLQSNFKNSWDRVCRVFIG